MNKLILIAVIAGLVNAGFADVGDTYVGARIGTGTLTVETDYDDVEFDDGGSFSIFTGYEVSAKMSVELEFIYQNNEGEYTESSAYYDYSEKAEAAQSMLLLNGKYTFANSSRFQPYVMGGVGVSFLKATVDIEYSDYYGTIIDKYEDDGVAFVYQFGLGTEIDITDMLSADLGIRGLGTSDYSFDGEDSGNSSVMSQAYVGLVAHF
jgi:opacity protein-like surface antigen